MIDKIKTFFRSHIETTESDTGHSKHGVDLATAALMVEIMIADSVVSGDEERRIKQLLCQHLEISAADADALFDLAHQEVEEATSLYQFTALVNDQFSAHEKFLLLKQLWHVAVADGEIDKHEEGLIRKLSELLHIPHSIYIKAKAQAVGNSKG